MIALRRMPAYSQQLTANSRTPGLGDPAVSCLLSADCSDPLRRPSGRHLPVRGRKGTVSPCVVAGAPPRPPVLRPRGQAYDSLRSCTQYSVLSTRYRSAKVPS